MPHKTDQIQSLAAFVFLCLASYVLFHFLGEPDFSGLSFRNALVPKLVFDEKKAVALFGPVRAETYLNYRVFSLFSGNFLALIAALLLRGHNQGKGASLGGFVGPELPLGITVVFFLINWVLPPPLSRAGEGGFYSIGPGAFSEIMISCQVGIYSFFLSVLLVKTFSKVKAT